MLLTATRLKILYAGLAAADTWLSGRPDLHRARFLTKPLLIPMLTASLIVDPQARRSRLRTATIAGQLGGWGGDIALLGSGTRPFLAGMGSFALGHLGYIAGFASRQSPRPHGRGPRVVAATWAASAPAMGLMAARRQREIGVPVLGYATLLSVMTAMALDLHQSVPAAARRLTGLGAALFLVSDSTLGLGKFVLTDPPPELERFVMATYTAAQLLISEGAARA